MSKVTVKIEGLSELKAALSREPEIVRDLLKGAVLDAVEVVQTEIEANTPRLTGALAGQGFTSKAGFATKNSLNAVVTIRDRMFVYAFYNEFGVKAHRQPARPFIRPAFEAKKPAAVELISKRLEDHYGN